MAAYPIEQVPVATHVCWSVGARRRVLVALFSLRAGRKTHPDGCFVSTDLFIISLYQTPS